MNRSAKHIQQEWRQRSTRQDSFDCAPWARIVVNEARKLHLARESCQERLEDLAIACRTPSSIFREAQADVLAAVRKCLAANNGLTVMKVASERKSVLRSAANKRKPIILAKTEAIVAFMNLLHDAQNHKGPECAWESMADALA